MSRALEATTTPSLESLIKQRNVEAIESLLNTGTANLREKYAGGDTCLHLAVKSGNVELVKLLLRHDVDVNEPNAIKYTPLHVAIVYNCRLDLAKLLIDSGADVTLRDSHGHTPLNYTRALKNENAAELLMGIALKRPSVANRSAKRQRRLETVDDESGSVQIRTRKLHSLLEDAESTEESMLCQLESLVRSGVPINQVDEKNRTALYKAAKSSLFRLAEFLVLHGAKVSGLEQLELVFLAVNNLSMIERVAEKDDENSEIDASLMRLADHCEIEANLLRVAEHCDSNNKRDCKLLGALLKKEVNVTGLRFKDPNALHRAIDLDDAELLMFLLERGADVNPLSGDYPLFHAVNTDKPEMFKLMVSKGAKVNIYGRENYSLLTVLVCRGDREMIKFVLRHGANPEDYGTTLMVAELGDVALMELLEGHGATVNHVGVEGHMVLKTAMERGRVKMVNYLLMKGADIDNEYRGMIAMDYVNLENHFGYDKVSKAVIQHAALLMFLQRPLHQRNLRPLEHELGRAYYQRCLRELESMRGSKISEDYDNTYLDVLSMSFQALSRFLKCEQIDQVLRSGAYRKLYPVYADRIECGYLYVRKSMEKVDKFRAILEQTVGLFLKNSDVIDEICKYYNDREFGVCIELE